ncbi:MAG: DUF456 domain-containing protein [Thermodesulfobacteriota bacterium]|nr:DUF456 domain-containing protein [Thermodesulfobacteriota bacterium]
MVTNQIMINTVLIIIGIFVVLAGLAGCILPVIPGPIVAYIALIILNLAKGWEAFGLGFMLVMAGGAVLMTLLDFFVSMVGARKYGAAKAGIWGSVIGMIVGIFIIPPWGIFIGALAGAIIGEALTGRQTTEAMRVGWGVFMGNVAGIALKLAYCMVVLFFYLKEMFV